MDFDLLPEDCFAHILSLTSPGDACRSSLVSSSVRSMADSNSVWLKFLPSDYKEILSRLVSPVVYSSNKELFLRLCSPCLIDGGKKIFSIEISTCKKCYMLSARELSITWGSHPLYWSWKPLAESRFKFLRNFLSKFAEVAELIFIWWLEIRGTINTTMLSSKTVYTAYLIVKFADRAYGLEFLPSEVSIEVGNFKTQGQVYLSPNEGRKKSLGHAHFPNRVDASRSRLLREEGGAICKRGDGWMEIELGRFFNDCNDKEVKISLKEVKGEHLKGGLIVEGIELRPKH